MIGITWHFETSYESPEYKEYAIEQLTSCQIYGMYLNFDEGQIVIPPNGSIDIEGI